MNRSPKGCSNLGGAVAFNMEYCRSAAMGLFSLYGYRPFSPAEFQLMEQAWTSLAPSRCRRLIALMSPLGEPCVLRGDLTLSAVAYAGSYHSRSEWPLRLCYADRVFASPAPPKYSIEESQVGVELLGCQEGGADAETASLLLRTLDLLGIQDSALVIGDASVAARLCDGLAAESARAIVEALQERNYSAYSVLLEGLDLTEAKRALLKLLPYLKGGLAVLQCLDLFEAAQPGLLEALEPLKKLWTALERLGYGHRLRLDLAFVRDLGYYSGPIYNAYSSSDGALLGGGGRYDGLLASQSIQGQAAGFALNLKELADHCSPRSPRPAVMLWAGGCETSQALEYAHKLAQGKAAFELSWASREDSLATAKLRGYRWWLDLGSGEALTLPSEERRSLEDFERQVLPC